MCPFGKSKSSLFKVVGEGQARPYWWGLAMALAFQIPASDPPTLARRCWQSIVYCRERPGET